MSGSSSAEQQADIDDPYRACSQSFDKEYLDEHSRDMSIEEYVQNIDQRVNLKVAQAIKQAMSLVVGKIDAIMDQKMNARFKLEGGKHIALEQRITNRLHDLIKGELAVKMIEQDMRYDTMYEKKRPAQNPLTVQKSCVQLGVQQQQKVAAVVTRGATPVKKTDDTTTQVKPLGIPQTKPQGIPKPSTGLKAPTINTNNLTVPKKEVKPPLKSILKSPKVVASTGSSIQSKVNSSEQTTTQSTASASSRNISASCSSPSPAVSSSYQNRRNELKMAKAQNPAGNKTPSTSPINRFQSARNAYKTKQQAEALNKGPLPVKASTQSNLMSNKPSMLQQKQGEQSRPTTPRSILKNKQQSSAINRQVTPKSRNNEPFSRQTTASQQRESTGEVYKGRSSNVSSITPTKYQSSKYDHIQIGAELVIKKSETQDKKKLKWSGDFRPVSTSKDQVDEIYKEVDPIGVSIQMRKDRGAVVTTVLRDTFSNSGRYYFNLKVKEPAQTVEEPFSSAVRKEQESIYDTVSDSSPLRINQRMSDPSLVEEVEEDEVEVNCKNEFNPDFSFSVAEMHQSTLEDKQKAMKQSIVDIGQAAATESAGAESSQRSFVNE